MWGIVLAVGGGTRLRLRGDDELVHLIDTCLRHHGLPRVPADLGLTAERYCKAVLEAPETRPDRFTILEHLAMDKHKVSDRAA